MSGAEQRARRSVTRSSIQMELTDLFEQGFELCYVDGRKRIAHAQRE
jgi:hypothetical protein